MEGGPQYLWGLHSRTSFGYQNPWIHKCNITVTNLWLSSKGHVQSHQKSPGCNKKSIPVFPGDFRLHLGCVLRWGSHAFAVVGRSHATVLNCQKSSQKLPLAESGSEPLQPWPWHPQIFVSTVAETVDKEDPLYSHIFYCNSTSTGSYPREIKYMKQCLNSWKPI